MRTQVTACCLASILSTTAFSAPDCARDPVAVNGFTGFKAGDGSLIGWGPNHVNVDGMRNAYHRDGRPAGAVISICNAGTAYTPDGGVHKGTDNDCHEMYAVYKASLEANTWNDPKIGAINWYGVLGEGTTKVAGNIVENYKPIEQPGSGGFYVSPTALFDKQFTKLNDQRRYVDAEVVSYATISKGVLGLGIEQGQFGVAYRPDTGKVVPFVVADSGPRVGEGSFALGRELAGLPKVKATAGNVYIADVESGVVWVLFGPKQGIAAPPFTEALTRKASQDAFDKWGGKERLLSCIPPKP